MLLFVWFCISIFLPGPVTGLALQPASKPSSLRAAANVTQNDLFNPTPNLGLATWCHVPSAEYDLLYSTRRSAAPLPRANIMYVISFLRETLDMMITDEGGSSPYGDDIAKITARGIGLYVWDEKLKERSLNELYDGMSALLLCALEQNMRYEVNGTLFLIEKQERFAGVAIRKVRPREEEGRNGTVALS
ncbi:MAG: hypothetical protein Q9212_001428 [Teloschistes hypoglaucus]